MPFCRRCGAQLEENARFCPKCGTPVVTYLPPPPVSTASPRPPKPWRKDPYVLAAIGLVVIIVLALLIVALLFAPFSTWDMGRTLEDNTPNVNTVNLNFQTNIGRININTLKIAENNIGIYIQANGSRGVFGNSGEIPLRISFENQTVGNVLTVDSIVTVENRFSSRANVDIQIFLDPALNLNLNVTSVRGQVSFTADKPTTIQALNLKGITGEVQANLQENVTLAGDISLKTTTGEVNFRMSQTNIQTNSTLDLQSTTGSVTMDIAQTKTLPGNLQVNADTVTGSINVGLRIDGGVSAKITSQTGALGSIRVDVNNFSGNKSPLQSNNYPAATNININNNVRGIGDVNIQATYQTMVTPTIMN